MDKEMSFEENLKELERLVEDLESGKYSLEDSIEIYEKAITLREKCRKFLEESEKKVEKLMVTANGVEKEEFTI
ncbi:MAG: exodeoxyribonuclease VII small subunit [archaeon]|nr:exodeoxyribonuclease VII small subunit [archaeon]